MRAMLLAVLILARGVVAAPAPDPYKASTWIAKLTDPREAERAVTELEQLGDPSAIVALGKAWANSGKPIRYLQVIITLARPLTPAEAKAAFLTDFEATGRPASWDRAQPFLNQAVADLDENNPRSVDNATKAAEAIGRAKLNGGIEALLTVLVRPVTRRVIAAQISAVRALGMLGGDKAIAPLVAILRREPPALPRTTNDPQRARVLEEQYGLFLGLSGSTINAIAELRPPSAAVPLVLLLYRTPELFTQTRRALVAIGPVAEHELVKVMRGEQTDVAQLFKTAHLDKYCGDKGDGHCVAVSAKDFYAAVVLGDFHDPAVVPALLAALARPPLPVYYQDGQPSANTQYNAIFDALRKLGAPGAAAAVREQWQSKKADLATRILAVAAYPFVARDTVGTRELASIVEDNRADPNFRQEATTALARLSRDAKDIELFQRVAQRYLDASDAKVKEAAGQPGAADSAAKAYLGFARMFQIHIARIEIAARCKTDLTCFAASLSAKPAEIVAANARYIPGVEAWSADDQHELVVGARERALLEIGKQGATASRLTDTLLDAAATDDRLTRQAILLALPRIAPLPCPNCVTKLDAAARAGDGKTKLADLVLETQVLRNYFIWAGQP